MPCSPSRSQAHRRSRADHHRRAAHPRRADLAEGYEYLAGNIRGSLQIAWAYQRDFPYFVASTGPYTKMGLDNPDTLYFHSYLRDDAEYVVTGRRGSTADLSFQVLNGDYSPVEVPDSLTAFDDRAIEIAADGTFELRFGPPRRTRAQLLDARPRVGDAAGPRGVQRLGHRAPRHHQHPPRRPGGLRAARAGPRRDGQALPRGRQDPAVPAADVPRLPGVVLPEAAGQHADRAAARPPAGWPPSSPRPAITTWTTTRR